MTVSNPAPAQQYPALADMGIRNAYEISGYSLRPAGAHRDVLKIRYKRAKGSLLPQKRTYKFGRSLKTVVADGGTARMEHSYEISPMLLKAVAELDTLVADNKKVGTVVKSLIGEEQATRLVSELEELQALVSSSNCEQNEAAISARFTRLKSQIAKL